MLQRSLTSGLLDDLSFSPAVGLLGPRQVGKTTLARQIASKRKAQWFDLQRSTDLARLQQAEQILPEFKDQLVVIDEIQLLPELFGYLRPIIDDHRTPGRFLLLGSASPELIRGASESLAGQIAYRELSPFGLIELGDEVTWQSHLIFGGYPEPLLHLPPHRRQRWYRDFITSYLTRDLAELGRAVNSKAFERLLRMLAYAQGGLYNSSSLARSLTVTNDTVRRYVSILEQSFLVRTLQPWLPDLKKRLVKSPRVYLRDSGLVNYLLGVSDYVDLLGRPEAGAIWEGYVIEEICRTIGDAATPYFYRSSGGAEVDLVLDYRTHQIAVEVKLSTSPKVSRGFYAASQDLQPKEMFVVTPPSGPAFRGKRGELIIGLPDLLGRLANEADGFTLNS